MKGWSQKHLSGKTISGDIEPYGAFAKKLALIGNFEREVVFHPTRKWRFDFCVRDIRLAVEIEGILPIHLGKSRHTTLEGFSEDNWKYAEAVALGWHVLRFTQNQIHTERCIELIKKTFALLNSVK